MTQQTLRHLLQQTLRREVGNGCSNTYSGCSVTREHPVPTPGPVPTPTTKPARPVPFTPSTKDVKAPLHLRSQGRARAHARGTDDDIQQEVPK